MPNSLTEGSFRSLQISFIQQEAAGTLGNRVVFTAPFDCVITNITESHTAAGTDGGAVSLQIEKLTGTQAPGAGAVLLSNNTNAGFNLKGAANTVQYGGFKAGASRRLARGNRIALRTSGVLTTVAGVNVSVTLSRK